MEAEIENAREAMSGAGYKLDVYLEARAKEMEPAVESAPISEPHPVE